MKRKSAPTGPAVQAASAPPEPVKWALPLIIALYLFFGALHIVSTPTGSTGYQDAPDEAAHVSYIETLAAGHMPTKSAPNTGANKAYPSYEWHQPPLYYLIAVPFLNGGERAIRTLSLFCGLGSMLLIYFGVRILIPRDEVAPILAAGIAALTPAHVAINSAVNNDALLELLFCAALVRCAHMISAGLTARKAALLGVVLGAALVTKTTALLLVPIIGAAFILKGRSGTSAGQVIRLAGITFSIALVLSGWWFIRNAMLYGELLPLHAFQQAFGTTAQAADVINGKLGLHVDGWSGYWMLVAQWCFQSFWAVYGSPMAARFGIPLFLPSQVYLLILLFCVIALAGLARLHIARMTHFSASQRAIVQLNAVSVLLVCAAYVLFASQYFQTQGRYLYPAMPAIAMLFSLGWLGIFPEKYRRISAGALLGFLCVVSLIYSVQTSNRTPAPRSDQQSMGSSRGTKAINTASQVKTELKIRVYV